MSEDRLVIKRKRGEDGYKVFSIRVKEETVARIDKLAADAGRSRNDVIGILLEYAVDKCSIE